MSLVTEEFPEDQEEEDPEYTPDLESLDIRLDVVVIVVVAHGDCQSISLRRILAIAGT